MAVRTMTEPAPRSTTTTSVAICVITYLRPVGLRRLLEGLGDLEVPAETGVRVVVVDNDPGASARQVVDEVRTGLRHPVDYAVESVPGIPAARNAAVDRARGADFVAFVDDDEWPDARWLVELLATQRATGADVVTGPVLPVFERTPPAWVVDGRFFDRPRHGDAERIGYARTSNVLIRSSLFDGDESPFDLAFGKLGGSDTHFFTRARMAGRTIVWADRAVVHETVPASRVTTRWLLQRQYRLGNTLSLCLRLLDPTPRRLAKRAAHGVVRLAHGAVLLLASPVRGRATLVRAGQELCFAAGLLSGLGGFTYAEYKVVHGK